MKKNWNKIRKIGKRNFILLFSLLYGLLAAIFSSLVNILFVDTFDSGRFWPAFLGMLAGGILFGPLLAYVVWDELEKSLKLKK